MERYRFLNCGEVPIVAIVIRPLTSISDFWSRRWTFDGRKFEQSTCLGHYETDKTRVDRIKKWRTGVRHMKGFKLAMKDYCCKAKRPSVNWLVSVSIKKIFVVSIR
jgi:hypothetical protein